MAGLYIHIPFCKQACHYCNFYFSTSRTYQDQFVKMLIQEIKESKNTVSESIESIYFGGGTPSLLAISQLNSILESIYDNYPVEDLCEITFEANPDDISFEFASELKSASVNRLSLGVQSFFDNDLTSMNRSHNGSQAQKAIDFLIKAGFENINVDLIYGLPTSNENLLKDNLKILQEMGIPHLSCYSLTIEEKTKLKRMIQKNEISLLSDHSNISQYYTLIEFTTKYGFEQYEISNFAKDQKYSKHNTGYWFGKSYLGFGPSAHSYYDYKRSWNVSNLNAYIKGMEKNEPIKEFENLNLDNQVNEYVMTRLRTKWGINLKEINKIQSYHKDETIQKLIEEKLIECMDNGNYILTQEGKLIADQAILQLMV